MDGFSDLKPYILQIECSKKVITLKEYTNLIVLAV